MSDIDIERLREAARRVQHSYESGYLAPGYGVVTVLDAVRFLLALADEGGELWTGECAEPHLGLATTRELLDEIRARIEVHGDLDYSTTSGGSRVRVWPPKEGS